MPYKIDSKEINTTRFKEICPETLNRGLINQQKRRLNYRFDGFKELATSIRWSISLRRWKFKWQAEYKEAEISFLNTWFNNTFLYNLNLSNMNRNFLISKETLDRVKLAKKYIESIKLLNAQIDTKPSFKSNLRTKNTGGKSWIQ